MKNTLKPPPYLRKGDKVAITAPASKITLKSLDVALEILQNDWQLEVILGNTIGSEYYDFADTLQKRTDEFQQFLDDTSIKLILCARGGYGCTKIIDNLNFDVFIDSPKWICGFSDITGLLLHTYKLGYQAIHGPMAKTLVYNQESNESLKNIIFGQKLNYDFDYNSSNILGQASGIAIGGNLSILVHSIGSSSDVSYDNCILFLEDISEYLYNVDRMLVQLKRAGKLTKLAGLVIGDFSDMKENDEPFGKTVSEIILEHVVEFGYPVAFGLGFGHEHRNSPIRFGENLVLEVTQSGTNLKSIS